MKIGVIVGIVVFLGAIVLASVFFIANNEVVLEEDSPLKEVGDNLEGMDEETREEFDLAVEEMKNKIIEMDEEMSKEVSLVSMGDFEERAHHVEGKALLIDDGGKNILRFENFDTLNGPALYIYLSSDLGAEDFVDLGPIKATKGNVNYELPSGVDTSKYNKVLVWCRPFGVLFSYAELK